MAIVVTGASGHVGANLVRLLVSQGKSVRALVHKNLHSLDDLDIELARGDVRDSDSLHRAFVGADAVFHLAALVSLEMEEQPLLDAINVRGTENVVAACRTCQVGRLVHFSSIEALSPAPFRQPVDESRALNEGRLATPYGLSKAASERIVRKAIDDGLDAIIVNPTAMIGPNDFGPSAMGRVLLELRKREVPALVNGGFDWVDVRDVVLAAVTASVSAQRGSRYLLSGAWWSLRDLADLAASITGVPRPSFVCPLWLARIGAPFAEFFARLRKRPARFTRAAIKSIRGNRSISHAKALSELGYRPRPLEETLRDTYQWFAEQGMLPPIPPRP